MGIIDYYGNSRKTMALLDIVASTIFMVIAQSVAAQVYEINNKYNNDNIHNTIARDELKSEWEIIKKNIRKPLTLESETKNKKKCHETPGYAYKHETKPNLLNRLARGCLSESDSISAAKSKKEKVMVEGVRRIAVP